jgi:flagellar biosynthesis protein FliQ
MLGQYAHDALLLMAALSLPILVVAALVGMFVAAFQAASQIQDPTLAHLPRMLSVVVALVFLGPWMAHQVASFAERMFVLAAR